MRPEEDFSLTHGGDCFSHWHSEDRVATRDFLHGLQGTAKIDTVTTSKTLGLSSDLILVNTTSGNLNLTLPKSRNGQEITFIKTIAANTMTLTAASGETINGATTLVRSTQWSSVTLKAIAGGWAVINGYVWDKPPYGAFSSTANQTVATINTPTLVAFNTTDEAYLMTRVIGDGFHIQQSGLYNVQFSVQLTNTDTQSHDAAFWFRKNGSDLAMTNSVVSVIGTHGGQPGYFVAAANFYIRLGIDDYVEMWWSTNSTSVSLQALPAITTPFVAPGAPSAVITVSYVSS